MGFSIADLLARYIKGRSEEEIKAFAAKLGTAGTAEEIMAAGKACGFDLDEAACSQLLSVVNTQKGAISDEDLEVVTGGCSIPDC